MHLGAHALFIAMSVMLPPVAPVHAEPPTRITAPVTAEQYIARGTLLLGLGLWESARGNCTEAWFMGDPLGMHCVARIYAYEGKTERAAEVLHDLLDYLRAQGDIDSEMVEKTETLLGQVKHMMRRDRERTRRQPNLEIMGVMQSPGKTVLRLRLTNRADEVLSAHNEVRSPQLDSIPASLHWDARELKHNQSTLGTLTIASDEFNVNGLQLTAVGMLAGELTTGTANAIVVTFGPEPDDRWEHKSLGVHALYGAYATNDGDPAAPSELDYTSMVGYGLTYQHGFGEHLAVDVDMLYAATDRAEFPNDRSRSLDLVRVVGHGVVRAGRDNVRYARLGLGVQMAYYDSKQGLTTEGPGDGFAGDLVVSVGVGYDRRMGDFRLGVLGTFAKISQDRSLDLGVHAAYGWE